MTLKEKLKKIKKATVMAGLAIAGITAPIKAQTVEVTPEKNTITAAQEHTDVQKRKTLEEAFCKGVSKDEIVKYIDFPKFIPVTKDGKFDQKTADDWAGILAPYMKTLAEKGDKMSVSDAYKVFTEATGQKNVSFEDFEQTYKMTTDALNRHKNKLPKLGVAIPVTLLGLGITSFFLFKKDARVFDEYVVGDWANYTLLIASVVTAAFGGGEVVDNMLISTPEKEITKVYSRAYDAYVDSTVGDLLKKSEKYNWTVHSSMHNSVMHSVHHSMHH